MLPVLPLVRLRFVFRLREALPHAVFQGSLWRGALGFALKSVVCIYADPFERKCPDCTIYGYCGYPPLFEPMAPAKDVAGGSKNAVRPFVLEPPLSARRSMKAGSELQLGMVLMGPAMHNLPVMTRAVAQLGERGLGTTRTRAALVRIEAVGPNRSIELWPTGLDGALPIVEAQSIGLAASLLPDALTLHFVTPTRLKRDRKVVSTPDAETVMRALLRRLIALAAMYGQPWHPPTHELIQTAANLEAVYDTNWRTISHVSSRQKRRMPLSGFEGKLTLHGVPEEIRALLLLGSLVHIGKQATYGHGWYQLTEEEHHDR